MGNGLRALFKEHIHPVWPKDASNQLQTFWMAAFMLLVQSVLNNFAHDSNMILENKYENKIVLQSQQCFNLLTLIIDQYIIEFDLKFHDPKLIHSFLFTKYFESLCPYFRVILSSK